MPTEVPVKEGGATDLVPLQPKVALLEVEWERLGEAGFPAQGP